MRFICLLLASVVAHDFLQLHSTFNAGTKYVDSSVTPEDTSKCGSTKATACTTIAQALATDNASADVIVLVPGEHDSETTSSTISRAVDITGNPNCSNTEDASLRIAAADITTALFTIDAAVTFEQLQFIVLLDTQFLLTQSLMCSTDKATLTLKNLTVYPRQYTEDVFVPLLHSLIDAKLGTLTLTKVNITGIPLFDSPLIEVSTALDAFKITESCTFSNIYRAKRHGAVFNVVLGDNSSFVLTDATFRNCSAPEGQGGAIFLNVTGTVDIDHFTLANLTFRQAGEALVGKFISVYSADNDLLTENTNVWGDILKDSHTEILNHFTYYNITRQPYILTPLNNFRDSIHLFASQSNDTFCGDVTVPCGSIKAGMSSTKYTEQNMDRMTIYSSWIEAETSAITFNRTLTIRGHTIQRDIVGNVSVNNRDAIFVGTNTEDGDEAMFVVVPSSSQTSNADPSTILTFANVELQICPIYTDEDRTTAAPYTVPVFSVHSGASLALVEVVMRPPFRDTSYLFPVPLFNVSGRLEFIAGQVINFDFEDVSLIKMTEDAGVYMSDGSIFSGIARSTGNGAVLEATIGTEGFVVISGTNFTSIESEAGGALYLEVAEGGSFIFGDTTESATQSTYTIFESCIANASGGGLYLNITGTPEEFTADHIRGTNNTATSGTVMYIATELTDFTSGPHYWASIIRENDRTHNAFILASSSTTQNLFEFVPDYFHVSPSATSDESGCGFETNPCKTIKGALESLEELSTKIRLLSGTHAAETEQINITRDISITGNQSLSVVKPVAPPSDSHSESVFTVFFDSSFSIVAVNFTLQSTEDAPFNVPFILAKSKYYVTLSNLAITMQSTDAPLTCSLIQSQDGRISLEDIIFYNIALVEHPLIQPSREYGSFTLSHAHFENITRNSGNGAIFELEVKLNRGLSLVDATFTNVQANENSSYGGSVCILVSGKPARDAFRLSNLHFQPEGKALKGTYVFVNSTVDGFVEELDRWADLLRDNPDAPENAFIARDASGVDHEMSELQSNAQEIEEEEEEEEKKEKFFKYLILYGGSGLAFLIIVAIIICCCCCCCRGGKNKDEVGQYKAGGLLQDKE